MNLIVGAALIFTHIVTLIMGIVTGAIIVTASKPKEENHER